MTVISKRRVLHYRSCEVCLSVRLHCHGQFKRDRNIATKSDYWRIHVCLSVRTEQLHSHWKDVIRYFTIFRQSVKKFQVSFQPDSNNGTLPKD